MKITQLAGSSCWASRLNAKTKKFTRIEIHSSKDISKLMLNDNFFVAGDDVADDIAEALQAHVEELGASLILNKCDGNPNVVRFWLAPPLKS